MKALPLGGAALVASCVLAAPGACQAPDVLIPSGSVDGVYRLVDRDGDNAYHADGEAYDYILHGLDSSVRNVIFVPGNPPRLWYQSTNAIESVRSAWDQNGDGIIDVATEETVALDFNQFFGGSGGADHEVNGIARDLNGVFWVTNDAGLFEGIYRMQDLTGDGDFDDNVGGVDETTPAFAEPMQVSVMNAPNSGNPTLDPTALDSVEFDPFWGAGRFLIEEENFDFTLALEDMNGDGDFLDAGEAYVFSALWDGGTLGADVNPDVTSGALPPSNEIRNHAIDPTTSPVTYYLMSIDTNAGGPDNAIIFKGQDLNQDGDVNDTGEVTVFWDGSADSPGVINRYNFCYGMHFDLLTGQLFVTAEFDSTVDEERLLVVRDANNDGDALDAGEARSVWRFRVDRTHYDPLVVPAGLLPAPPPGIPGTYRYFGRADCPTSHPSQTHNIQVGTDNWNDKPTIGNPSFFIRTWGANANAAGVYHIGVTRTNIVLDPPMNLCHVYTIPIVAFGFSTDANGVNETPLPIPNDAALIGSRLVWQSGVADPGVALLFSASDGADMRIGPMRYSYSVE